MKTNSKHIIHFLILFLFISFVSAAIDVEKGTQFIPTGANATYNLTENMTVASINVTPTSLIIDNITMTTYGDTAIINIEWSGTTKIFVNANDTNTVTLSFSGLDSDAPYNDIINQLTGNIIDGNASDYNVTMSPVAEILIFQYGYLANCTAPYNQTSLNITIYDEDDPSVKLNASLEAVLNLYYTAGGTTTNISFSFEGNNNHLICIWPPDASIQTDGFFEYTTDNGFTHRYYLVNETLTNSTTQLDIYNFNTTTGISDLRGITRYETNYNYFTNVIAHLQRFYTGDNVWRTVQMDESGDFGLAFFNIREESTIYRLRFFDRLNHLLHETESMKFACDADVCELTFLLNAYAAVAVTTELVVNATIDNATGIITVEWEDQTGRTQSVRVLVEKETLTGTTTICNSEQSGAAGVVTCNASAYTGEFLLRVFNTASPETAQYFKWLQRKGLSRIGDFIGEEEGAFWTFGIVLTLTTGAAVINLMAGVIVYIFSLIIIYFLGLFSALTLTLITTFAVLGIGVGILLHKGRKE